MYRLILINESLDTLEMIMMILRTLGTSTVSLSKTHGNLVLVADMTYCHAKTVGDELRHKFEKTVAFVQNECGQSVCL